MSSYFVHLRDSGFSDQDRAAAEVRYRTKLERQLGGEDKTVETYRQWDALVESDAEPTEAEKAFGKRWMDLVRDAMAAGFKGMKLPEGFEGYFEIRLAR